MQCEALRVGFRFVPGQSEDEGGEAAGARFQSASGKAGGEAALAAARGDLHRRLAGCRRAARPGREGVGRLVSAATGRRGERRVCAAENVQDKAQEGHLRVAAEARDAVEMGGELAGQGVGLDLGRQLSVDALFVGHQPEAEEVARFGGALVDRTVQGVFEGGYVEVDRADLRCSGAVGSFVLANTRLVGAARFEARSRGGVDRYPLGQGNRRRAQGRGRKALGSFVLGYFKRRVEAAGRSGFRGWSGWRQSADRRRASEQPTIVGKGHGCTGGRARQLIAAGGHRDFPRQSAVGDPARRGTLPRSIPMRPPCPASAPPCT